MKKINSLSVVIPLYNEEKVVKKLIKELNSYKNKFPNKTDVIFVDDGSRDKTVEIIKKSSFKFKKTIIQFSRNFGHQAALLAGLSEAKGDVIVTMDADLQHPIKLIPEMLKLHKNGYDVVLTKRVIDGVNNRFKKITANIFYYLINLLSSTKIEANSSDFRSINKSALKALLSMPENRKFLRGMVQWIGFKSIIIPFEVEKRAAGESKYSIFKMFNLASHGLTSFSTKPLYISGFFSIILFLLALAYMIYVLYIKFFGSGIVSGWASVIFVLLIVGGFLSLFMGLLGVYLAAIYEEIKSRPNYVIRRVIRK